MGFLIVLIAFLSVWQGAAFKIKNPVLGGTPGYLLQRSLGQGRKPKDKAIQYNYLLFKCNRKHKILY